MRTALITELDRSSIELREMVKSGKAQAARPDAHKICRLSDQAIAEYERLANEIDKLTSRFPEYKVGNMTPA